MTEQKKSDGKKSTRKIKASTGAWWKAIVEEEPAEAALTKLEEKRFAPSKSQALAGDLEFEELTDTESARRKSPQQAVSKEESVAAPAKEEAKADKPRSRRSQRSRKTESKPADQPHPEQIPTTSANDAQASTEKAAKSIETVTPVAKKPTRKGSPRKKQTIAEEKTETAEAISVSVESAEVEPAGDSAAAAETAVGEKKQTRGRKRTSRSKRGPAAKDTVEETVQETEGGVVAEAGTEAVEAKAAAPQQEKALAEKPAKTPRKRLPKKKKAAVSAEDDKEQVQAVAEQAEQAEQADLAVAIQPKAEPESAEGAQAEASVDQAVEEQAVEPQPKKKSGQRRSRGRRGRNRQAKEATEAKEQQGEGVAAELEGEPKPTVGEEVLEAEPEVIAEQVAESEAAELAEEEEQSDLVLKLLINAEEPEECRLALLENGRLESIHVSTINRTQTKNNIYKGKIVAIEPNLQAAFVDYGTEKNGFLPFSEIHPEYYKQELPDAVQQLVDTHHWKRLSITDVVEKGQELLVQVVKEEVGKKGANMTTYLSLPGRSVVLMPGSDSSGISRKISGEERRGQLRKAMNALDIPEGIGWIVRTASVDITKTALSRDVGYLLRLWEEIKKKAQTMDGVGQVYEDHQSVLRFLREHFDPAIEEILVDAQDAMEQVKEFISLLPSAQRNVKVRMHKGSRPIFNQFSVEDQIESIYQPKVNLPSGGSIVIEPTEALVSIDVNSGSTSKGKNFDQSIYQANLEAASELARQLRLRDLGGLIVVDFIDMRNKKHIRDVERQLKQAMRRDKAKVDFSRISKFGLMQISRQKLGSPIEAGNYRVCSHCKGRGTVRSVETLALFYLRRIQTGASRKHVAKVECHFPLDVAQYLLNNKRHEILEHETRYNTEISIIGDPSMSPIDNEIILHKGEKDAEDKKQA